jgi:hypothetical protein
MVSRNHAGVGFDHIRSLVEVLIISIYFNLAEIYIIAKIQVKKPFHLQIISKIKLSSEYLNL